MSCVCKIAGTVFKVTQMQWWDKYGIFLDGSYVLIIIFFTIKQLFKLLIKFGTKYKS